MGRAIRTAALMAVAASGAQAFAPATAGLARPALRSCTSAKPALRMADEQTEYKPIIPTADNSMAPDYAKEPTQFERQGLVDSGAPAPKTYGGPADAGLGGLTRREVYGVSGAAAAGVLGVAWALTRNPGYDRKGSAREAGKVEINAAAVKEPKIQEAIAELKETRGELAALFETFKKDKNAQLSEGVAEFEITNIRNDLNAITFAAFDEDTQILTDRLSRNIIQVCPFPTTGTRVKRAHSIVVSTEASLQVDRRPQICRARLHNQAGAGRKQTGYVHGSHAHRCF